MDSRRTQGDRGDLGIGRGGIEDDRIGVDSAHQLATARFLVEPSASQTITAPLCTERIPRIRPRTLASGMRRRLRDGRETKDSTSTTRSPKSVRTITQ